MATSIIPRGAFVSVVPLANVGPQRELTNGYQTMNSSDQFNKGSSAKIRVNYNLNNYTTYFLNLTINASADISNHLAGIDVNQAIIYLYFVPGGSNAITSINFFDSIKTVWLCVPNGTVLNTNT